MKRFLLLRRLYEFQLSSFLKILVGLMVARGSLFSYMSLDSTKYLYLDFWKGITSLNNFSSKSLGVFESYILCIDNEYFPTVIGSQESSLISKGCQFSKNVFCFWSPRIQVRFAFIFQTIGTFGVTLSCVCSVRIMIKGHVSSKVSRLVYI